MAGALPGGVPVTRGHLPRGSAVARAVGQGPRGPGPRGEGVPRQPGILDLPGRARGRMQAWQKWSFPVSPLGQDNGDLPAWRPVRKSRRITRLSLSVDPTVAG